MGKRCSMMKTRELARSTLLVAASSLACGHDPQREELDWLRANAIPLETCEAGHGFTDLEPLAALVGDARIVSLGECTHGTREVFQMKHRLVEYLASRRGFTIFSIEANMPEAYRLNEYVLEGKGDPKQLIAGMYFWTWNTEEVLAMVEWMREFNRSGKGRIEFTGFDMQTPDVAMDVVLDFLETADPQRVPGVKKTYGDLRNGRFRKGGGRQGGSFGVATGSLPVEAARGKHVRYGGWIKTEGVRPGYAGLWMRVDGPSGMLAIDNMQGRGIRGDTDWTQYALELDVPEEAVNIAFGALHPGRGKAWFDDLKVEIDGKPFDAADRFDLDFEGPNLKGFHPGGEAYTVAVDDRVAKVGRQSLRIELTGVPAGKEPADTRPDPAAAAKACGEIVAQLEASRDRYVGASSEKATDWAIQNARVVHQCLRLEANEVSRDESMATNVKWILDHAPKETKIVLWAHNGHVGRRKGVQGAMGGFLDEWYGKDQVVCGFAAGDGRYTAIVQDAGLHNDNRLQSPIKGSFEEYFRASGRPRFILDLRHARQDDPASAWLTRPHAFRSIGAIAMDGQFMSADIRSLYDAIIYLDTTSASRSLPQRAPQRF